MTEDIVPSEISQTQRERAMRFCLHKGPKIVRFVETESRKVVSWTGGGRGRLFHGYGFSVLQNEKVLEMIGRVECECF